MLTECPRCIFRVLLVYLSISYLRIHWERPSANKTFVLRAYYLNALGMLLRRTVRMRWECPSGMFPGHIGRSESTRFICTFVGLSQRIRSVHSRCILRTYPRILVPTGLFHMGGKITPPSEQLQILTN